MDFVIDRNHKTYSLLFQNYGTIIDSEGNVKSYHTYSLERYNTLEEKLQQSETLGRISSEMLQELQNLVQSFRNNYVVDLSSVIETLYKDAGIVTYSIYFIHNGNETKQVVLHKTGEYQQWNRSCTTVNLLNGIKNALMPQISTDLFSQD